MTLDAVLTARDAASAFPSPLPAFTSSCAPSWTSPGRGAFLFFAPWPFLVWSFYSKLGKLEGGARRRKGGKTGRQYTTVWRWDGIPF